MPLSSWRRLHGDRLVAQVDPVPVFGTWTAHAWIEGGDLSAVKSPIGHSLLTTAQAIADDLVQRHYNHVCNAEECSDWFPWTDLD